MGCNASKEHTHSAVAPTKAHCQARTVPASQQLSLITESSSTPDSPAITATQLSLASSSANNDMSGSLISFGTVPNPMIPPPASTSAPESTSAAQETAEAATHPTGEHADDGFFDVASRRMLHPGGVWRLPAIPEPSHQDICGKGVGSATHTPPPAAHTPPAGTSDRLSNAGCSPKTQTTLLCKTSSPDSRNNSSPSRISGSSDSFPAVSVSSSSASMRGGTTAKSVSDNTASTVSISYGIDPEMMLTPQQVLELCMGDEENEDLICPTPPDQLNTPIVASPLY